MQWQLCLWVTSNYVQYIQCYWVSSTSARKLGLSLKILGLSIKKHNFTLGNNVCLFHCSNCFLPRELCSRSICHGRVSVRPSVCLSVRLSVTSRCCTKMAKHRQTQTTPHDSLGTLVFWCQKSIRNSNGVSPNWGAKWRWGRVKSANFDK